MINLVILDHFAWMNDNKTIFRGPIALDNVISSSKKWNAFYGCVRLMSPTEYVCDLITGREASRESCQE